MSRRVIAVTVTKPMLIVKNMVNNVIEKKFDEAVKYESFLQNYKSARIILKSKNLEKSISLDTIISNKAAKKITKIVQKDLLRAKKSLEEEF